MNKPLCKSREVWQVSQVCVISKEMQSAHGKQKRENITENAKEKRREGRQGRDNIAEKKQLLNRMDFWYSSMKERNEHYLHQVL